MKVSLERGGKVLHTTTERFGFRTVELRPRDGLYVNGVKVRLKGVNRHSFWPDSGRTTSRAVSETDVRLIKDMNMNAVRMSHYPPDRHFLEVCDELGLFVLDELTGWQKSYDTEVGTKLVRELVVRDVNHPSVILWDNGNEGGFNYDLVDDFHLYDPQKRPVLHPWQNEAGKINTTHYRGYDCCAGKYLDGPELVMPTEVLHGLYDGGHGAGLSDLWGRMLQNPLAVGAFLWALADEGIVRTDRDGALDTDGNHAPDGIVGPYREKEASFFTIKEVWSPVFLELGRLDRLPPTFDGRLRVENRYDFTEPRHGVLRVAPGALRRARLPHRGPHGRRAGQDGRAAPRPRRAWHPRDRPPERLARLRRPLPDGERPAGPRHPHLDVDDPKGPDEIRPRVVSSGGRASGQESAGQVLLEARGTRVAIDRATGQLASVERDGRRVSLANGPRIVEGKATLTSLTHRPDGDGYVVEAAYEGPLKQVRWRLDGSGWLELSYRYVNPGRHAHLGVTFDYPESQVAGLKWLGRGPYRVWKNRTQGNTFDVWQKAYNDTATGADWTYPEFKGHHADFYWAVLADEGAADHGRHRHRGPLPARPHPPLRREPDVHRREVPGGRPLVPARDPAHRHEVRRPGDDGPRGPAERVRGREPHAADGRIRGPAVLPLRRRAPGRGSPGPLKRGRPRDLHGPVIGLSRDLRAAAPGLSPTPASGGSACAPPGRTGRS